MAISVLLAGVLFAPPYSHATRHRKYKPPPPMAAVTVTVLRAADGQPLKNAAVVFHLTSQGTKNEGNMELKTNDAGKATLSIVPLGSEMLVQVIADGYRTFGKAYDVPSSKKSITIKLLPPNEQYSIYQKFNSNADVQNNTPKTQMGHSEPVDSPLLQPPPKKKK
jgi:hypothetical protein